MPVDRSYKAKKWLCVSILSTATSLFWGPSGSAKQPAVFLKEHSEMQGDVDILIGKSGLNMLLRKSNTALIMSAPDWNVIYVNRQSKRYFQCKPDQWKMGPSVFSAMCRPSSPTSLRLTSSKKTNFRGLPCEVHSMETFEASRGTDKAWKRLLPKKGLIWLYPQARFSSQAYRMVANFLAIPAGPGIPVAMEFSRCDDDKVKEIVLYGFEKRLVEDSEFKAPKGFQQVMTQAEALDKSVESKDFADFLKEK